MLTVRVVPCLDVRDGRVVKGVKFSNLRDSGDPGELAASYDEQGADEIVVLDVAATPEGRKTQVETVARVRAALSIPLTVGGGIRGIEDAEALLDGGADKVAVNTAAVLRPELLTDLAGRFGSQATVLAVDAGRRRNGGWQAITRSGTDRRNLDAVAWCMEAVERGAGEILLTSWDRDGTRAGYDVELIGAVSSAVAVPVVASGGASRPDDLADAAEAGATAVLAASIFHEGEYTVGQVKAQLAARGLAVRP